MKNKKNMSIEELKKFDEVNLDINEDIFEVNDGFCKDCNGKLIKIVENKSIFDGALTFHIIKLKCENCGKEYLDLNQAEKYDLLLTFEKISKQQSIRMLSKKISECIS